MPFQSKSQQRWMFANHPRMAERWAAHTKDIKSLPEHASGGEEKQSMLKELAAGVAAQTLIEKLASDTNLEPALVPHLAAKAGLGVVPFVKLAYADPEGFTAFLKLASGAVKPRQFVLDCLRSRTGIPKLAGGLLQRLMQGAGTTARGIEGAGRSVGELAGALGNTRGGRSALAGGTALTAGTLATGTHPTQLLQSAMSGRSGEQAAWPRKGPRTLQARRSRLRGPTPRRRAVRRLLRRARGPAA
jgi:hypothetical protein